MSLSTGIKPNFFIIGAPKCGTTALSYYLSTHPEVHFADPKEAFYFHTDFAPGHRRRQTLEEYMKVFDAEKLALATAVGEGTVWYLFSETAVPNILDFNSEARFIVMVRDPLELAQSLHSQMLFGGEENVQSFERAWRLQKERRSGRSVPSTATDWKSTQYGPVAKVGEQLERLYGWVPEERVKVIVFDDLRENARSVYQDVVGFLGLPDDGRRRFPPINESRELTFIAGARLLHHLRDFKLRLGLRRSLGIWSLVTPWLSRRASNPPLEDHLRAELLDYFRDDIATLSRLLGRDLSHWGARQSDESLPSSTPLNFV